MRATSPFVIAYGTEGFQLGAENIYGRRVANRGILKSVLNDGRKVPLYGALGEIEELKQTLPLSQQRLIQPFDRVTPRHLDQVGALFWPSPAIANEASRRLATSPAGWSIIGLTHSLPDLGVLSSIRSYQASGVREYDALVCTSNSVRTSVQNILDDAEEYLRRTVSAQWLVRPHLPVIPLGVDSTQFAPYPEHRSIARKALGLSHSEFVIVSLGRLDSRTKINPIPTLVAAQRADLENLKLAFVGSEVNPAETQRFRDLAGTWAPGVEVCVVPNASEDNKRAWLHAADLFLSLVDNLQESFGLSVLEAMAAGLPVLVSDWSGYKDTVQHGVHGFRVPTIMPPPEHGTHLGMLFEHGLLSTTDFLGMSSERIVVDVEAAVHYLRLLHADASLRDRLGSAGRNRAGEVFDWARVIDQYDELCDFLGKIRQNATQAPPPLRPSSPFHRYKSYSTRTLDAQCVASLVVPDDHGALGRACQDNVRVEGEILWIHHQLSHHGACTIAALLKNSPESQKGRLVFSLGILAKLGIVHLKAPPS